MWNHKFIKNKKGQAMVETIFVLPLLFLLIFGIIEFGRIYFTYMILSNAAREGARYSVVGMGDDDVEEHIVNVTSSIGNVFVDIDSLTSEDNVIVRVDNNLELIMPIVGPMIDKSDGTEDGKIALHASAEMRVEND